MRLGDYLAMTVTPLSEYKPTPRVERKKILSSKQQRGNEIRRDKGIAEIKAVLGDKWMTVMEIDAARGWKAGSRKQLTAYGDLGYFVSRRVGRRFEWHVA